MKIKILDTCTSSIYILTFSKIKGSSLKKLWEDLAGQMTYPTKLQQVRLEWYEILPQPRDAHKQATKQISALYAEEK
jgi:hypothetical protein